MVQSDRAEPSRVESERVKRVKRVKRVERVERVECKGSESCKQSEAPRKVTRARARTRGVGRREERGEERRVVASGCFFVLVVRVL